ncbi:unnamed protein product [Rotaria sordida]|uniref:BZIP domain-containing protein n=1 Tax=Rotaria sordida TaxID=392033 RepID=A0A815FQH9_9BILA|nr:unnamed protein product [Rotaria sordida]CAF1424926.1 unnamed protein product [Rotaria sordida]CAF3791896.1 unnamed protein product [Rotaria sordida]CAF4038094.1 unnamed protein product [Rotaria sordida]
MTSNKTPSYTTQHSNTSTHSNENKICSKKSSRDEIQYGPIHIRVCRRPAPTIATGRRPKHLVLAGEEAIKRDRRRERNREAARKLKERRQCIEDELIQQLKELQGEHANLQEYLHQLRQRKQDLQQEINNCLNDPIDKLLSNNNQHVTLFFEQYLHDSDFIDEPLENFLTSDLDISFKSIIDN